MDPHRLRTFAVAAALGSLLVFVPQTRAHPQPPAVRLSGCADMEAFLKTARIVRRREIPVGVTLPQRATLDDGRVRHDAAIQDVDIQATQYSTSAGTELNFRDTWKFNVAGYELAKTIELNMVPPYVERSVGGTDASLSWWVADTMMERDRIRKRIVAPDAAAWNGQMYAVRLFHELIGDSDFNATNILITQNWRVWMIDFTRAFRRTTALRSPERLKNVDRRLLTNLQALTRETLRQRLGRWLLHPEIDAVEARRDAIVAVLERERAARGDAAVFYELPQVGEPCGAGLD